jgi:uncharacterized protein (DUF362 family)
MFAYDKRDRSTYTDPELVHHLVKRLLGRGFATIRVVEAQSTCGQYFDKRSVSEVAAYLGYDGSAGCEIVDMTLDATERRCLGPHLGFHPVSRVWSEADFRISFAKSKTHAYSYYTLTLKNIYGALPLGNKFKEYHCGRDIYHTTSRANATHCQPHLHLLQRPATARADRCLQSDKTKPRLLRGDHLAPKIRPRFPHATPAGRTKTPNLIQVCK